MEVIATVISILGLVGHVISLFNKSDNSSTINNDADDAKQINLSKKDVLNFLYDKELTKSYATVIAPNFNYNQIENIFRNKNYGFFRIDSVIKQKNCSYIEFTFLENYTRQNYNTTFQATRNKTDYFTINNFYSNKSFLIYGSNGKSPEIESILNRIANELINDISK